MVQPITQIFGGYKPSSSSGLKKQTTQQNISSPYSASNTSLDSSASSAARAMASASISFSGVFIPKEVSSAIDAADNMRRNADEKIEEINKLTEHTIKPITERANKMRSFEMNGAKPAAMTEYEQDGSQKRKIYFLGNEWIGIEEGNIELFLKNNEITEYREGVVFDYSPGGKDTIEKDLLFENGEPVLYKEGIENFGNFEKSAKELTLRNNECFYQEELISLSNKGLRSTRTDKSLYLQDGNPRLYKEGIINDCSQDNYAARALTYDDEGSVLLFQEGFRTDSDSDKVLYFDKATPSVYIDKDLRMKNCCLTKLRNKWVRSKI